MSKLQDYYKLVDLFSGKLNDEQKRLLEKLEDQLITEEILPAIGQSVAPVLRNLRSELTLVVEYNPTEGITVKTTRSHVAVQEHTTKRYQISGTNKVIHVTKADTNDTPTDKDKDASPTPPTNTPEDNPSNTPTPSTPHTPEDSPTPNSATIPTDNSTNPTHQTSHTTPTDNSNDHSPSDSSASDLATKPKIKRKPNTGLCVWTSETEFIQERKAAFTMVKAIQAMDIDKVAALKIRHCRSLLVSKERHPKYTGQQHELSQGYLLTTHSSTQTKRAQLERICSALGLDWRIEIVE